MVSEACADKQAAPTAASSMRHHSSPLNDLAACCMQGSTPLTHGACCQPQARFLLPCTDAGLWPVPCAEAQTGRIPAGGTPTAAANAHLAVHCRFFRWLKPGGKLLVSDYCKGPGEPSDSFAAYIRQRGYDLHTPEAYGKLLEGAGFTKVKAEDRTWQVGVQSCCA